MPRSRLTSDSRRTATRLLPYLALCGCSGNSGGPVQDNVGGSYVGTANSGGNTSTTIKSSGGIVAYVGGANGNGGSAVSSSGQGTIQLPSASRNGIVNLVVAVTNANAASGGDDNSNKGFDAQEHFSYQARIVSGGVTAPNTTRPW